MSCAVPRSSLASSHGHDAPVMLGVLACVLACALGASSGCLVARPDLTGKSCSNDGECDGLPCAGGRCGFAQPAGEGEGEGEGEGAEGEGEGEGEGDGNEGEGEGEGEGDVGEGEGEGEGEGDGVVEDVVPEFEAWAADQPSGGTGENCLGMRYTQDRARDWRDRGCGESLTYACDFVDAANPPAADCLFANIFGRDIAFCPTPLTFDTARLTCEGVGGQLLRIDSLEENQQVQAQALALLGATPGVMFLAATDIGVEAQWFWLDGEPLPADARFSPWENGAPDGNEGQNCMELGLDDDIGLWQDVVCTATQPFICEVGLNTADAACTPVDSEGKRFLLCPTPTLYADADATCRALGGTLARIDTSTQNDALTAAAAALATPLVVDAFIGGRDDVNEEGVWVWPDGEPFEDLRLP